MTGSSDISLGTTPEVDLSSFSRTDVAVVFDASGGIGNALIAALKITSSFRKVVGFSRKTSPPIELQDEASLERATTLAAELGDLRLVVDATGFLHHDRQGPEKTWRQLDADNLARSFALNAIGPALMMKYVLPRFPRSGKAVFATLSARVGSIGDNQLGGRYGYRASKAALNQFVRTAAVELARRSPEAVCVWPCILVQSLPRSPRHSLRWDTALTRPPKRPAICWLSSTSSRLMRTGAFSTGAANLCLGSSMAKMRVKSELPVKTCAHCGRPFTWRKKWVRDWESVKYCSRRCGGAANSGLETPEQDKRWAL